MNTALLMSNLLLWSAQAACILGVTAAVAHLLRSAPPAIRLALWQIAVAACLLMPVIAPWQHEVVANYTFTHATLRTAPRIVLHAVRTLRWPSAWQWFALSIVAGALVRFALLAAGLYHLRRYRQEARPLPAAGFWSSEAELLVSADVPGPVTFGLLEPAILLPESFATLGIALRETILYHEILHVRRKDWLFAVGEEILRAVFWFHPGIWWATHEIRLAREEAVDREVVDTLNAREAYVDALLAVAGAPQGRELAPAPFFLRRKHLKRRVVSIFREVNMSKKSSVSALLAGCFMLALSCWFVSGTLPLKAQPQSVFDSPGVSVDIGGVRLLHRGSVSYPAEVQAAHIEGTVTAQLRTNGAGEVVDANIVAGPDELRKYVLQSVLSWHFASDSANTTRPVSVTFTAQKDAAPAVVVNGPSAGRSVDQGMPVRTIQSITVNGLSDSDRERFLASLPIHVGDAWTNELRDETFRAAKAFDQHMLMQGSMPPGSGGVMIALSLPSALPAFRPSSITTTTNAIRVAPKVAAANLVTQVQPEYPPLALAARVQGTVSFDATIGKDGTVQSLHLISGPPLLVQASMQALQKWVYKPVYLNNQPVEVATQIDVEFTLPAQ